MTLESASPDSVVLEISSEKTESEKATLNDKLGKGWQVAVVAELAAVGLGLYLVITGDQIILLDRVFIGIVSSLRLAMYLFGTCININIFAILIVLACAIDVSYICVRTDSFNNALTGDVLAMLFYYLNMVVMNCDFINNSVTFINWVSTINSGNATAIINKKSIAFSVMNVLQLLYSLIRNLYLTKFMMKKNKDSMRQSLTKDEVEEAKLLFEAAEGAAQYFDIVSGIIFTIAYYVINLGDYKSFVAFSFITWLGSGTSKITSLCKCGK